MNQLKRVTTLSLLLSLLALPAFAENVPTSQFGINGWPYRHESECNTVQTCPQCGKPNCSGSCAQNTQTPPVSTPAPTATPAPASTPIPTPQPTLRPAPTRQPSPTATPTASGNVGDYTTLSVSAQEYSAWNLLNADREANGESALTLDEELCAIARIKSCDMKNNNYFAHVSPTFGNAAAMLTHFGYDYQRVGENIAHHSTVEKAQAAFMSSSGHRINILGSQWTRVGVGICYDDNGYVYVTQLFAR